MTPKCSWVILTHNRGEIVREAITHCLENSGAPEAIEEIVWIDNGSTDKICREFMMSIDPEIAVLNSENRGVAKGYNQGMGLATQEYILITGCDMKMPDNWLRIFLDHATMIPNTGIACMYSTHWTSKPERIRRHYGVDRDHVFPIVHALPIERRIFKRELLADFGYFPESLGLYGYDDIAWANRAMQVCLSRDLLYYVIPDHVAEHLGTEGINLADGKDSAEYHAMKRKEALDPAKQVELQRLERLGWPKFSPFP